MRVRDPGFCRHFTGLLNTHCRAGVAYGTLWPKPERRGTRPPCYVGERPCRVSCALVSRYSEQEKWEQDRESRHACACVEANISPCCEAPVKRIGHRDRYCIECGEHAWASCADDRPGSAGDVPLGEGACC